jgi:hypothetical protein
MQYNRYRTAAGSALGLGAVTDLTAWCRAAPSVDTAAEFVNAALVARGRLAAPWPAVPQPAVPATAAARTASAATDAGRKRVLSMRTS